MNKMYCVVRKNFISLAKRKVDGVDIDYGYKGSRFRNEEDYVITAGKENQSLIQFTNINNPISIRCRTLLYTSFETGISCFFGQKWKITDIPSPMMVSSRHEQYHFFYPNTNTQYFQRGLNNTQY